MLNYKDTNINKGSGIITNFFVLCLFLVCVVESVCCLCDTIVRNFYHEVDAGFFMPYDAYYVAINFDSQYTEIKDNVPDGWTHASSYDDGEEGNTFYQQNMILFLVKTNSSGGLTINSENVTLPIYELNLLYSDMVLVLTFDGVTYSNTTGMASGNPVLTNAENLTFVQEATYDLENIYLAIINATFSMLTTINYKDEGGTDFSGTHATGYSTKHMAGEETTLDTPTKSGYTFGGWFLNDPNCNESARVQSLSASEDYDEITLYAKWIPNISHLTFNCTNFSVDVPPSYMVYVYYNDNLVCQLVPSAQTTTIDICNTASTDTYTLLFVFGYYGELSVTAQDGITVINRKIVIDDLSDRTINYSIYTPRINSSVII